MKRRRERLTFDFKSIKFKTWLYFMLLSFVVLGMLWVVQIVFFNTGYRAMKVSEIRRTGDKMAEMLADRTSLPPNFQQIANDYAAANGVAVMIARRETDGNLFHVLGYAGTLGIADETENESDFINLLFPDGTADVLDRLDASDGSVCYSDTLGDAGEFIVYGARVSGAADMMYVFMLSPVRQSEAAVVVMMDQLLICTVICLFLSIILTYFVANHLSRPIVRFSQVASRLGQGDYSVRFEGNGFTEIDELADTLNYATEEMGKTESLRRDFLANVSHDLRTPLTMVKAYAEMIRDISGNNREKREEHAQVIIDEADRLAALVEDIQNLSKLQSGTVALEKSEFDLGALTRTVIERFGVMAEHDGYVFRTEIADGVTVTADSRRIEQVLYNLIGNAVNYTGEDKTVTVRVLTDKNGKALFAVTDTGKGIPEDEIPLVWDKYYRANMTKRSVVGSGLGLSIVKNILQQHGAEFGIYSEVGKGSTFWFRL